MPRFAAHNSAHTVLDFAHTHEDAFPLLGRCTQIQLAEDVTQSFAEYAQVIAQAENLDGRPLQEYVHLVASKKNSLRAVLAAIESGAMLSA